MFEHLQEFFGDETAANYATAGAFARMKGTKYFAVARVGDTGELRVRQGNFERSL